MDHRDAYVSDITVVLKPNFSARLKELIERYPQSPFAEMARKDPLMQAKTPLAPAAAVPAPTS